MGYGFEEAAVEEFNEIVRLVNAEIVRPQKFPEGRLGSEVVRVNGRVRVLNYVYGQWRRRKPKKGSTSKR